ncbi:MAG: FmdE family protein [Deltaproteobacteria bacterium]|nr:FmdE family protein [Deltaproteobacteria bacterium]
MSLLQPYLEKAEKYHGHICSGQILGIRMALLGLKLLGLKPEDDLRDLVVFLETDRCVADAAYVVTGITVGRRRVKMHSYGKTAMSFLDLKSGKAYRIAVKTSDRPPHGDPKDKQVAFWEKRTDEDIFAWQEVAVTLSDGDLPGPPVSVVVCSVCGEDVLDRKEVLKDGQVMCRACAEGAYYRPIGA